MKRNERQQEFERLGLFLPSGAPSPLFEDLVTMLKLDLWLGDEKAFEKRLRRAFSGSCTGKTASARTEKKRETLSLPHGS